MIRIRTDTVDQQIAQFGPLQQIIDETVLGGRPGKVTAIGLHDLDEIIRVVLDRPGLKTARGFDITLIQGPELLDEVQSCLAIRVRHVHSRIGLDK